MDRGDRMKPWPKEEVDLLMTLTEACVCDPTVKHLTWKQIAKILNWHYHVEDNIRRSATACSTRYIRECKKEGEVVWMATSNSE